MEKKESDIELVEKTIKNNSIRVDIREKIRGEVFFTDDYTFKDLLHIVVVRSKIQRGKIQSILLPHIPRGYYIFSSSHIPGSKVWHYLIDDWKFLADQEVNFYGEPILLIAGPDLNTCNILAESVKIEYTPIPPIDNILKSLKADSIPIYKGEDGINCFKKLGYEFGNNSILSEKKLNIADVLDFEQYSFFKKGKDSFIMEEIYHTGLQEHAYIETQGFISWIEDDVIFLKGSIQCPFYVLKAVCQLLNLPPEKIRVQQAATGGAFGGKEEYPSIVAAFTALVTFLTKKPSKLILERTEDIETTTKRHPSDIYLRINVDKENKIKSIESDIILDAGAYCGISPIVLARSEIAACGVYKVEAARVEARAMATNKVISGAFRGFGAPQSFFAIEVAINHAADRLNISPIYFRKINHLKKDDYSATGGKMRQEVLLSEMLDWINKETDFDAKYLEYREKSREFIKKISFKNKNKKMKILQSQIEKYGSNFKGIGISSVFHGCGFTGRGEENIKATVRVKFYPQYLYDDSSSTKAVEIYVATVEIGQGMLTVFTSIASSIFDIPKDKVKIISGDTHLVPDSGPTVASRTTMIVGGLIYDACQKIKKGEDNDVTLTYKSPDDIFWDEVKSQGDAYPAYSWGVCVTEVDFSFLTFTAKIEKMTTCMDIGKALNEKAAIGQVLGGFAQSIGWALTEKCEIKNGRILQRTFTDYAIPTSLDMPIVNVKFFDNPYEKGPFGAKCLGELPFVLAPASILHAIENSTSTHFSRIPLTPELIQNKILG